MSKKTTDKPKYVNTGYGPDLAVIEIGLADQVAIVQPDTAFWAIIHRDDMLEDFEREVIRNFAEKKQAFTDEMKYLRFGLKPSAVYFNPTERCNSNCSYCYLPEEMRANGKTMTTEELCHGLEILKNYFGAVLPPGRKPQIIFHGSEPLLGRDAVLYGIERYQNDFIFGIQTNAILLDDEAITFFKNKGAGIGISLDAPDARIADQTRRDWNGRGYFAQVLKVMKKLADYPAFNVITTVTKTNINTLPAMVDFYHTHGVSTVMFNPVRCTLPGGRDLKPENNILCDFFFKALDRVYELYEKNGQRLVVANFANILAAITGPTGRRLMCDISPCGGGRCFFAVSATGDVFPCSEFIGNADFRGGNLYKDGLPDILASTPFASVTKRKAEEISPCGHCAVRHFCGAPCPAEIHALNGTLNAASPYCEFFEEQVRYAFRVIAMGRDEAYLWDNWRENTEESFRWI